MGFFERAPRARPDAPHPRGGPWERPRAQFPRAAASALLLARTEVVAVAVSVIWAYPEGFEFWVQAQFREERRALDRHPADQSLHVGVQFADGRKAADVSRVPEPAGSVEDGLILRPLSFGGGLWHQDRSYWVWPLPPPGPLWFVCAWDVYGIPESRAAVDARQVLEAAGHSIQLWPENNS